MGPSCKTLSTHELEIKAVGSKCRYPGKLPIRRRAWTFRALSPTPHCLIETSLISGGSWRRQSPSAHASLVFRWWSNWFCTVACRETLPEMETSVESRRGFVLIFRRSVPEGSAYGQYKVETQVDRGAFYSTTVVATTCCYMLLLYSVLTAILTSQC